ncbi:hypothetical protein PCG10_009340 [Penicillium crustosum]|uniref:Uncharacterized protein n=1 Tax=Penicillium crustosum TaxID=36656 RepID=A0A9P5L0L8_PENCR|nr:uncharacterized protein N7487_003340 [Penicillium crustosum]KAF7520158.1 hypothetical protein PCG10_009340 [Penicillium crustosum]KAJ5419790.1 hypothetical protein N7487_003340 [Penicillium crustosum]
MPNFQPSIFQSSQLEHGHRFHFKDPHNSQPGWIWGNVALPPTMGMDTSDLEIIVHVCNTIAENLVGWSDTAQHGLGKYCVSFPIQMESPQQDKKRLMFQVEYAALWWVNLVRAGTVSIDKHFLFRARQPPVYPEDRLLDTPLHWRKPEYMVLNPWSVVTVSQ